MQVAPPDLLEARIASVTASMAARQLDALLITNLANVAYLTGFFASTAAALVTGDAITLIGDGRYAEQLAERSAASEKVRAHQLPPGASYDQTIADVMRETGGESIGFEASHLTVARYNFMAAALARSGRALVFQPTDGLVELHRAQKDWWEIAKLRDAAARLSDVAKCILPKALAGRTESEVAADIEYEMRRAGFERPAFDTIVAAGPNAARPHARASGRRIEAGELVVLDFGGVLDGYCTDMTRTVTAGPSGARERRLIEQVIEAQSAAFERTRAGSAPESVDAAARDVLKKYGMGDAFTHGTGHGLGLEVHEAPRLSPARSSIAEPLLAAGMIMTLEPGAYFPGWGGVRIEDDVLVTADGAEWLTDAPKAGDAA
jgi:Xaa-Pro aminopeptidase